MAEYNTFRTKAVGPVTQITPKETEIVTPAVFNEFTEEVLEYIKGERPAMLVLSLEKVARYTSEAIGGLIRIRDRVVSYDGEMKLCVNKDLRQLFKLTNLDGTLFEIHATVSEAVAAFFD